MTVKRSHFQLYTVKSLKIKCCNATFKQQRSECALNAPFTSHMYLSYRMRSFPLFSSDRSASQWGEIREEGSAKMITFTSSSLLYLWRTQALKPLTVGVKGPKRIHEILTLGTSSTRRDGVEAQKKKHHCQANCFVVRETFQRQTNKQKKHGKTKPNTLPVMMLGRIHGFTDAWRYYLALISGASIVPGWIPAPVLPIRLLRIQSECVFLAWDVSTSVCQQLYHMLLLKRLWGS